MMDPLSLLLRYAMGERLKKSTPADRQWGAVSMLMIAGLFLGLLALEKYHPAFLDRMLDSGTVKLWVGAVLGISFAVGVMVVWIQRVPYKVTLVLAITAWLLLLGLLFGLGWWDLGKL